jgi:O-antigen/teichoic acid export membrane protein
MGLIRRGVRVQPAANCICLPNDEPVPAGGRATTRSGQGFAKDSAATVVIAALVLVVGLLTGVIVARTLGPEGRGALTAVLTAPQLLGWLFAMGCGKAVTFDLSRDAALGARLLATWLVIFVPVGAFAVTIGAQSHETLDLARLYMPTIVLVLLSDLVLGILLGDQDFLYFNVLSFAQPAGVAAVYVLLWQSGHFTVASAVATQAVMSVVVLVAAMSHVVRRHGLAWPDFDLGRRTFWYALRTHGEIISGTVTQRLDLLIIPAFLTASSVGFYAIATSISWIIVNVCGPLALIVMPAAAHRGESGRNVVIKSLHATLIIGILLGSGLFLFADLGVRLVYGEEFSESVLPLLILLPGTVLYAAAFILLNGLYAENRPFTATIAQMLGMVVTVAGLLIFLRSGGILAAAIVSTVAYGLVFVVAGVLYWHATGLRWQSFLPEASEVRAMLDRLLVILRLAPNRVATSVSTRKPGE